MNACEPLETVLASSFPAWIGWAAELKALFAGYVEAKQASQVLDYDDLLLYWAEMLSDPDAAAALGSAFDHVFVDEYQDTNRLQAKILLGLKPDGRGLTVVGDDAQAIYGFRAAEVRNILDFPGLFDPPARVVTLEQNYRSTEPILAAANAVIGEARERFTKDLWSERRSEDRPRIVTTVDETAQVDYVCSEVLAAREAGIPLKEQAVLFRTAQPQRRARAGAHPAQHPLRQVRRAEVPRGGARQGPAGDPALRREPARPGVRLPGAAADARHRGDDRRGHPGPVRDDGRAPPRWPRSACRRGPPSIGRRSCSCSSCLQRGHRRLAGRDRGGAALV